MPIDPALGRGFVEAVTQLRTREPGLSLDQAVRQHLLDTFDSDRNGRIDIGENTNLFEIYNSLY